jgi:hypothetical protein
MPRRLTPTADVPIPRSAPLTERITATSRTGGTTVTVERYGPLRRAGRPIEWVRWSVAYPDGQQRRWACQATGSTQAALDGEFDRLERDLRADRQITDVTRTP